MSTTQRATVFWSIVGAIGTLGVTALGASPCGLHHVIEALQVSGAILIGVGAFVALILAIGGGLDDGD